MLIYVPISNGSNKWYNLIKKVSVAFTPSKNPAGNKRLFEWRFKTFIFKADLLNLKKGD